MDNAESVKDVVINLPPESIIVEVQKVIAEFPEELWYDKKWVIVLISLFFGTVVSLAIKGLAGLIKKRSSRRAMAKNLYTEVSSGIIETKKSVPMIREVLALFTECVSTDNFDIHPSINHAGEISDDFYNSHLKELHLFDYYLRVKIVIFYQYLRSTVSTSKLLESQFKQYYEDSKMVSGKDVIKKMEGYIRQKEALELIGIDVLANLIVKYKADTVEGRGGEDKKEIIEYLKMIKTDEVITIKAMVKSHKWNELFFLVSLIKSKKFKYMDIGKYKKVK